MALFHEDIGMRAAQFALYFGTVFLMVATAPLPVHSADATEASVYYPFSFDSDHIAPFADFSFNNKTLTAADRIVIANGHFERVGSDGKVGTQDDVRVRFWGVNLVGAACFPPPEKAEQYASRLAKLGVNLVRLHHMDSFLDDGDDGKADNTPTSLLTKGPYPTINKEAALRLKVFVEALAAHGIYVDVNLHVGYRFRPGIDPLGDFPQNYPIPPKSKPLQIFVPKMIALQSVYAKKLAEAIDARDANSVAMVEINNESSLVDSYKRGQLAKIIDDRIFPIFKHGLMKSASKYKDDPSLAPSTQLANIQLSDLANPHAPLSHELVKGLIAMDRDYLDQMKESVRQNFGNVPVTGTQMAFGGLSNIASQVDMDYVDNHFYVDAYRFPAVRWDRRNWTISNVRTLEQGFRSIARSIATRVAGRPYMVSEFNQSWPNETASSILPLMSMVALQQDWDGLIFFNYSNDGDWNYSLPNGYSLKGDASKLVSFGLSGSVFRSGSVSTAKSSKFVEISAADIVADGVRQRPFDAVRDVLGKAGIQMRSLIGQKFELVADIAGLKEEHAQNKRRVEVESLTWLEGMPAVSVQAPTLAAVIGRIGTGRPAGSPALSVVSTRPTTNRYVSVLLASKDGLPVAQSRHLILLNPGRSLRSSKASDGSLRPEELRPTGITRQAFTLKPSLTQGASKESPSIDLRSGFAPQWMTFVPLQITFAHATGKIAVYPLDERGARKEALSQKDIVHFGSAYKLMLEDESNDTRSPWYEIEFSQ